MILATASGAVSVDPTSLEWLVHRTVTDKLERALRALSREGWLISPVFQGGRDWTLVCCRETEPARVPSSFPHPPGRSSADIEGHGQMPNLGQLKPGRGEGGQR